jgi:hypothetical protein
VVRIDLSGATDVDGGVGPPEFQPTIRDCNEDQALDAYWLLDHDDSLPLLKGGPLDVPPSGRDLSFTVPLELLDVGCHRLEVRASGALDGTEPVEPGDLGRAVWWLAVVDESTTFIDMTTCPNEQL